VICQGVASPLSVLVSPLSEAKAGRQRQAQMMKKALVFIAKVRFGEQKVAKTIGFSNISKKLLLWLQRRG
jgi:hypothetical protein